MEWLVRVWTGIAARIRTRVLVQLRNEVSTCEYEDVHVMWEMLRQTEKTRGRATWSVFEWAGRGRGALCCTF
ncbi:uncharacterized protein A4U43_C03F21700 [Asparagus officinalis]|uniref:Uncharacterized protein n=1 Tax=Asparagus officinalis TaxID=4686 RepID=A0A5P1FBZ7_ASPOF|nr:uncharacterized protein A4U43_C03F21700 [Asparagus officinalis]